MASIDERVVAMKFDNAKFEAGVAKTLATLTKLNESLKRVGATNGLKDLEKSASKVNFSGLSSALDKLKEKLRLPGGAKGITDVEGAANKVTFGPLSSAIENIKGRLSSLADAPSAALSKLKEKLNFTGADKGLNDLEAASQRVKFAGPRAALDLLKEKLRFTGVDKNFAAIETASTKVRFSGMISAVGDVRAHFSSMTVVATAALATIASKATTTGVSLAKSLTVDPITQGLAEYETNLNSIQTILANTEVSGAGLKEVNAALEQLNEYSDQTIYNFSEMAKNIGTFTAAGVDLKTSTKAIKGIANLAALSGSNSQQAAVAMYQLSQAISSGRVSLQDWNSVVNAGMGGTVFQRALAQTAQAMGTLSEGSVKLTGKMKNVTIAGQSFRESITAKPGEESWLTSDVLTTTLSQFTGDLSKAELAAMGFNEEQIKAIQKTAITAKKAATEVKTLSGVFDVVKESIGSGWSKTFQTIFGDFTEAKSLFTSVTTAITDFIGESADARNKVLADWKALGGRTALIDAIKDAFLALASVVKPIKEAFREIFPKKTGQDLFELTKKVENFFEKLKIGPETAENLKRTFAGFFAILSIGKRIATEILGVFGDLLDAATSGSGGFLEFTGTIGDFLVSVDRAIKEGEGLKDFFTSLGRVLSAPVKLLSDLAGALGSLFDSGDSGGLASSLDEIESSLNPLTVALNAVNTAWDNFLDLLGRIGSAVKPVVSEIGSAFAGVGEVIAEAFENLNFDRVFAIIQTTLIGGIFFAIKRAFGGGLNIDLGGGVLSSMSETFNVLTGSLKALQTSIQAGTLLKIATAVAVLAAGVLALSLIDPKRLASAMTAVSVGLGQLVGAMALLSKIGGATTFATMPFIAASLILLATAIDVLAIAVFAFSRLSWEELAKGLVGVAGALTAIGVGLKYMPPSLIRIGVALLPIAVALNLIATAVKIFSTLAWDEIAKGLVAVAGALRAISLGVKTMGPSLLLVGPGLIAVAVALNILAGAVLAFGSMDLKTMGKGLLGIAVALKAIGFAIATIPPNIALQAAGLILVGVALTGIAGAIALMGNLAVSTIAKGLAAIGASLVILGHGLMFMIGTLPGAAALLIAATALAVLAPVLGIMGSMKWSTIAKGLAAIALSLLTVSVVGVVAAPVLGVLGIALLALGSGIFLVGKGVSLLADGLLKLGVAGPKGVAAVVVALSALVALLPKIVIDFVKGLVEIAEAIVELAPKIVESIVQIIDILLVVIVRSAPKVAKAMTALISSTIAVIDDNAANIIGAGFRLLLAFLSGIADNIGEVITQAGEIVVNFLTALGSQIPNIVAAGANVLVKFLSGLVSVFPKVIAEAANTIVKFLTGITQNLPKVVAAAANLVVKFVDSIAANIGKVVKSGVTFIVNLLAGIENNVGRVVKAAVSLVGAFITAVAKEIPELVDKGAKAVINFVNGVASAIRKNSAELGRAGANLGTAIVQGAITGMGAMAGELVRKALSIFSGLPGPVRKLLGINSPSRVFMEIGNSMMEGTAVGIDDGAPGVIRSLKDTTHDMVDTMTNSLRVVPDLLDGLIDMEPVITPVLDLSSVQKSAKQLGALTNVVPITAAASYVQAKSISAEQEAAQVTEDPVAQPVAPVTFNQNNYSPEALSAIEIYRLTRNQLAQAKSALGIAS